MNQEDVYNMTDDALADYCECEAKNTDYPYIAYALHGAACRITELSKRLVEAKTQEKGKVTAPQPLSFSELHQRDGKRVWVEIIGTGIPVPFSWAVVNVAHTMCYTTESGFIVFFEDYGKRWVAYDTPPAVKEEDIGNAKQ